MCPVTGRRRAAGSGVIRGSGECVSVLESVERDLAEIAKRDKALAESALAATAKQLACELDAPKNSATSKAMCAGKLIDALDRLRELAPVEDSKGNPVDELGAKREARRAGGAAP